MANVKSIGLFPWCVYESRDAFLDNEVGDLISGYAPFSNIFESFITNVETSMALYWRVKKWKMSGFFKAAVGFNDEEDNFVIVEQSTINFEFFFKRNAQNERDLICRSLETGNYPELIGDPAPSASYYLSSFDTVYISNNFGLQITNITNPISPNQYGFYTNQQLSNISNFIYIEFGHNDGEANRTAAFGSSVISPSGYQSFVNLQLLGLSFQIPVYINDSANIGWLEADNDIAAASIEAVEYWPYDPEDGGGPVYDQFTGAIIRPDFFN